MANTTTKILGLAVAGATAWGLWSAGSYLLGDDEASGTQHVVNQVWVERLPEGPRDMIGHFILLDLPEGRIGGVGRSSQWRHLAELFQYGLEGHRLSVFFPQDRVKGKVRVRSWRCEGEAPAPFELCLELSDGRRTDVLYSMEEWRIDPNRMEESLEDIGETYPEVAELAADSVSVSIPVAVDDDDLDSYADAAPTRLFGQ